MNFRAGIMHPSFRILERWRALSEGQRDWAIYFLFSALSLTLVWPVLKRPASLLCAAHGDSFLTLFWLWWYKTAWIRGLPWNSCPMAAAPFGVDWAELFERGIALPGILLARLANETLAYNVLTFISFPLAAIAAYHLSLYLVRSRAAAVVSGVIYSLAPYHLWKSWAWIPLANIQWLAIYCLSLLRWHKQRTLVSALVAGACLALVDFFSHIYFLIALCLTLVFAYSWVAHSLLAPSRLRGLRDFLLQACAAAGVALILLVPLIYPILFTYFHRDPGGLPMRYDWPLSDLYGLVARWSDYLLPAESSRLYPLFAAWDQLPTPRGEYTNALFLGFTALLLSVVGVRSAFSSRGDPPPNRFALGFFAVLFLAAGLLSLLPPTWSVALPGKAGVLELRGPAYFVYIAAPWFREFARFGVLVVLSVAVLAAFGMRYLLTNWPAERNLLIGLVACGLLADYSFRFPGNFPIETARVPEVYHWLAAQPGDFSIAEYPEPRSSQVSPVYLYYVTVHGKRLINGHGLSRPMDLIAPALWEIGEPQAAGILRYLGARYVLWHSAFPGFEQWFGTRPQFLPAEEDFELVRKFNTTTVLQVRAEPARIIASPGDGFTLYSDPDHESTWWWLQGSGTLNLINVTNEPHSVLLRMQLKRIGDVGDIKAQVEGGDKVSVLSPMGPEGGELVLGPVRVPCSHLTGSNPPAVTRIFLKAVIAPSGGTGVRRLRAVVLSR